MTIRTAEDLGKRISEIRRSQARNQKDIAKSINVSQGQYSKIEHGVHRPSFDQLIAICDYFGVTPNDLLGYSTVERICTAERTALNRAVEIYKKYHGGGDIQLSGRPFAAGSAGASSCEIREFRKNLQSEGWNDIVLSPGEINEFLEKIKGFSKHPKYAGYMLSGLVEKIFDAGCTKFHLQTQGVPIDGSYLPALEEIIFDADNKTVIAEAYLNAANSNEDYQRSLRMLAKAESLLKDKETEPLLKRDDDITENLHIISVKGTVGLGKPEIPPKIGYKAGRLAKLYIDLGKKLALTKHQNERELAIDNFSNAVCLYRNGYSQTPSDTIEELFDPSPGWLHPICLGNLLSIIARLQRERQVHHDNPEARHTEAGLILWKFYFERGREWGLSFNSHADCNREVYGVPVVREDYMSTELRREHEIKRFPNNRHLQRIFELPLNIDEYWPTVLWNTDGSVSNNARNKALRLGLEHAISTHDRFRGMYERIVGREHSGLFNLVQTLNTYLDILKNQGIDAYAKQVNPDHYERWKDRQSAKQ